MLVEFSELHTAQFQLLSGQVSSVMYSSVNGGKQVGAVGLLCCQLNEGDKGLIFNSNTEVGGGVHIPPPVGFTVEAYVGAFQLPVAALKAGEYVEQVLWGWVGASSLVDSRMAASVGLAQSPLAALEAEDYV